jgi:1-deoxy-D-xylulose-5-phosphate synthase
VHVVTKKGIGYKPAENNPSKFHSTSPFDISTGNPKKRKSKDYSKAFGDKLVEIAEKNDKIVAITAAMGDGTGLSEFSKKFPNRFFDVGIAEQHAVGMAAGMSKSGLIPVIPIYSSFYQRAYDQVIHDICLQNLHVIMCADRAGIVGSDGETHQGLLDMASFSIVPNMTIMAPKDFEELDQMMEFAVKYESPILIRYPRGGEGKYKFDVHTPIKLGKSEILKSGNDITIIAIGKMVEKACLVADELKKYDIEAEVINARFLKPIDNEQISKSIEKTKNVITIEDGILRGGLATSVNEIIIKNNLADADICVKNFGYDDKFVKHGQVDELEKLNGLDTESIVKSLVNDRVFAIDGVVNG